MNIKKLVYNLLKDRFHLRNDRESLIIQVLAAKGIDYNVACFIAKYYKQAATIDRMWRQIQEQNEELRGKHWQGRQDKQIEVKKDLGYNL